jgi:hypothetical protein
MNTFDIPDEWHLSNITFYQLNLLSSEMKEREIRNFDQLIHMSGSARKLKYPEGPHEEGFLNIPIGRCKDSRCFMHLFGKMNGTEFKSVARIGTYSEQEFPVISERIKCILTSSTKTLKRYYLESDIKGIKEHLTAFLFVF